MRFLFQSGVSIVQGLIVSSVLAGSALVTTRMLQDQKKLQKSVETRDQVEQLHRLVVATLQNREHCSSTISAAGLSAPTLDSERNVDIIYSKTAAASVTPTFEKTDGLVFEPTKIYMNGNVSIRSMKVMLPKSADPDPAARTITYPSKFRIEYRRMQTKNSGTNSNLRTKEGFGAKQIVKYVPILLQINKATNLIDGCYAVQLGETMNGTLLDGNNNVNQDFCSNLGNGASLYTWDSTTNKCVLKNNVCPDKFIFGGISSTGNAYCYPLSKYLPDLVNTTDASGCTNAGGTVALVTDAAGKVKITCTAAATGSCTCSAYYEWQNNGCTGTVGSMTVANPDYSYAAATSASCGDVCIGNKFYTSCIWSP